MRPWLVRRERHLRRKVVAGISSQGRHVLRDPSLSNRPLQNGLFNGLIWPKAGCASIAYAAMAPIDFLPLPAAPPFLAKQQSRLAAILRCAAVASDAASIAFGLPIAIEAAMGAGSEQSSRRTIMATIGTFKKTGNNYTGEMRHPPKRSGQERPHRP